MPCEVPGPYYYGTLDYSVLNLSIWQSPALGERVLK